MIIFIVTGNEGSYDSYTEWNDLAFVDREKAKARIKELEGHQARYNQLIVHAWEGFREWSKANPHPAGEAARPFEKGATPQEMSEISKHNQEVSFRNNELRAAWGVGAEVASRQIVRDLGATEQEVEFFVHPVYSRSKRESSWEVEEIELVE